MFFSPSNSRFLLVGFLSILHYQPLLGSEKFVLDPPAEDRPPSYSQFPPPLYTRTQPASASKNFDPNYQSDLTNAVRTHPSIEVGSKWTRKSKKNQIKNLLKAAQLYWSSSADGAPHEDNFHDLIDPNIFNVRSRRYNPYNFILRKNLLENTRSVRGSYISTLEKNLGNNLLLKNGTSGNLQEFWKDV